ncbi:RNA polymerase sigma-70 factor (ECF subfamily) [Clostridiales Family XIII bacterium PM5-7]
MLFTLIQTIYHGIEQLIVEYKKMMLNLAYSILKDSQLAEDALQEASIKLAGKMNNIDNIHSDRTKNFVYTVTKNAAISVYRKEKKFRQDVQFFENNALSYIEGALDIDAFADQYGFSEELKEALSQLGEMDRDIICYKYGAGYKTKEIATAIGHSPDYVYKRLQRAEEKLALIIKEMRKEDRHEG